MTLSGTGLLSEEGGNMAGMCPPQEIRNGSAQSLSLCHTISQLARVGVRVRDTCETDPTPPNSSSTPSWAGWAPRKRSPRFSRPGRLLQRFSDKETEKNLPTLNKQMSCVHSLTLDAVCSAGIGASVFPTDRCHRQAAVTHLGAQNSTSTCGPHGLVP